MVVLSIFLGLAFYQGGPISHAQGLPFAEESYIYSHDVAREAFSEGRIQPLDFLLARLRKIYHGVLIDVTLHQKGQVHIYHVRLLEDGASVQSIWLDALSGAIIESSWSR